MMVHAHATDPLERVALDLEPRLTSLERLSAALEAIGCYHDAPSALRTGAAAALRALALAGGEALTNVVRHGAARRPVRVILEGFADRITLQMRDDGPPFDMFRGPAALPADPLAETGRGLFLIRESVDELAYRRVRGENVHTMTVKLQRAASSSSL